jgi:DNA invertase Pin-like site-specific DNA recombinase
MKYGYARVSAEDQNAAMQHTALRQAGRKAIFTDELSGAMTKRPALLRCLRNSNGVTRSRCGSSTGWAAACAT